MKIGKVVSFKALNLSFLFKLDRVKFLLYFVTAIGIISGFVFFSREANSAAVSRVIFSKVYMFKLRRDILISFLISFVFFVLPIVLLMVFGSSVFGVVVIPLIILFINALFGTLLAYSYHYYRVSGLAFNSLLLIPSYFIFLVALILSATSIMKYSLYQLNCLYKGKNPRTSIEFSYMLKKQVLSIIILIPASLLEVLLNRFFIHNFNF